MTASSVSNIHLYRLCVFAKTDITLFNDTKLVLQTRNHCNKNHFSAFLVPKSRHGIKERLNDVIVMIMSLITMLTSKWVIYWSREKRDIHG